LWSDEILFWNFHVKKETTNYCEGHTNLKSETKFRKILHCAVKMTALKVYLPPLLLYNEWQLLNYFNHDILCICQNQNNNKNFPYFFLLEFQIILIIMQLSTTKTRNHETTNFSLLSKTLLSLNKKQNKKIKTHNLIFFMMNYLVDKILDSNTNQHFCH
jgi:hypothetical protein